MNEGNDYIAPYDQIAAYFNQVPMWPLVLLAAATVVAGIYELYYRKRRNEAAEDQLFCIRFRACIPSLSTGPEA